MTVADEGGLVELASEECWQLLGSRAVGRLAFVDPDGQHLFPVNYAVHEGHVYLRTAAGSRLGRLGDGHDAVALQADHLNDLYELAWSVTVAGSLARVTDSAVVAELDRRGRPRPWAPGERAMLLALTPRRIDGRRIRHH